MSSKVKADVGLSASEALFAHRLLIAIERSTDSQLTIEMIVSAYQRHYPPSRSGRVLQHLMPKATYIADGDLMGTLAYLVEKEYFRKDITRFIRVALDVDTPIYSITAKGRQFLHVAKSK